MLVHASKVSRLFSPRPSLLLTKTRRLLLSIIKLNNMPMKELIDISVSPDAYSLGNVAPEFVSATMDFWPPNAEGWGNSSVINAQFSAKLIGIAKALSPFFLRIGGSQADTIIYDFPTGQNTSIDELLSSQCQKNAQHCLTQDRWEEVLDFADESGARIVFTLAYLLHTRDDDGNNDKHDWDSANAKRLLEYTANSRHGMLGTVYGFELGNELRHKGKSKNVTRMVEAYKDLRSIVDEIWQTNNNKPFIIGPACTGKSEFSNLLAKLGPFIDIGTYHKYHGGGKDANLPKRARQPSFYAHPMSFASQPKAVVEHMSNNTVEAQLWIGEGAMAYNSGRQGVTNSFVGSLWYADLLGSLAKTQPIQHSVYCRQALIGGYYELVSHETLDPNPDYWVAYLWKSFVGTRAIGPILSSYRVDSLELSSRVTFGCCKRPGQDTLLIHAFCANSGNNGNSKYNISSGDMVFVVINIDEKSSFDLNITLGTSRSEYVLTPHTNHLTSQKVLLNGQPLSIRSDGTLSDIQGNLNTPYTPARIPPKSISFLVSHGSNVDQCSSLKDNGASTIMHGPINATSPMQIKTTSLKPNVSITFHVETFFSFSLLIFVLSSSVNSDPYIKVIC